MKHHQITPQLALIESPPQGAVLQCVFILGDEADVFAVGMNRASLASCSRSIDRKKVSWAMNDGSLRITGSPDKLTLSFAPTGPSFVWRELILEDNQLQAFKKALRAAHSRLA